MIDGFVFKIIRSTESITMDQIQVYKEMIHAGIIVIDEAREEL
jgi:hypothetical protein